MPANGGGGRTGIGAGREARPAPCRRVVWPAGPARGSQGQLPTKIRAGVANRTGMHDACIAHSARFWVMCNPKSANGQVGVCPPLNEPPIPAARPCTPERFATRWRFFVGLTFRHPFRWKRAEDDMGDSPTPSKRWDGMRGSWSANAPGSEANSPENRGFQNRKPVRPRPACIQSGLPKPLSRHYKNSKE